jgi:hypothetical protein
MNDVHVQQELYVLRGMIGRAVVERKEVASGAVCGVTKRGCLSTQQEQQPGRAMQSFSEVEAL